MRAKLGKAGSEFTLWRWWTNFYQPGSLARFNLEREQIFRWRKSRLDARGIGLAVGASIYACVKQSMLSSKSP